MTKMLLVNQQVPWPLDDGNALRVLELARHRDPDIECHLACFPISIDGLDELTSLGVFDSITMLPLRAGRRHWRRHFRLGNRDFIRLAYPTHFATVRGQLRDLVRRNRIDVIVAVLQRCEEYTRNLTDVPRIVDQYDCITLAHERQLQARKHASWHERLRWNYQIRLARSVEEGLGQRCDLITSIAPNDVSRLKALNPGATIVRLPNGIRQELLDRQPATVPLRRGVAFWGNLGFPVNRQAIDHFLIDVWRPYLASEGVEVAIVGPHADDRLKSFASKNQGIILPGYVPDLFSFLDQYPVMVNPMVTGGGLKNKVLEAFATGHAVVSTGLGVDAFPEMTSEHCCIVDDPAQQASAVLELLNDPQRRLQQVQRSRKMVEDHYTWRAVGSFWSSLLRNAGGVQLR